MVSLLVVSPVVQHSPVGSLASQSKEYMFTVTVFD